MSLSLPLTMLSLSLSFVDQIMFSHHSLSMVLWNLDFQITGASRSKTMGQTCKGQVPNGHIFVSQNDYVGFPLSTRYVDWCVSALYSLKEWRGRSNILNKFFLIQRVSNFPPFLKRWDWGERMGDLKVDKWIIRGIQNPQSQQHPNIQFIHDSCCYSIWKTDGL